MPPSAPMPAGRAAAVARPWSGCGRLRPSQWSRGRTTPSDSRGPNGTVDFLDGDGRTALAADLSSIAAQITRENLTIEGPPPDRPILVNEIGRMEAGVIRFKGDVTVTFRKTALGALRYEERQHGSGGAFAAPGGQGQAPELQPRAPPRWVRKQTSAAPHAPAQPPSNRMRRRRKWLSPPRPSRCCRTARRSRPRSASLAPAAVQMLLQRAQLEAKPARGCARS